MGPDFKRLYLHQHVNVASKVMLIYVGGCRIKPMHEQTNWSFISLGMTVPSGSQGDCQGCH